MTEDDELLEAILEDPDDDAPRLAYAEVLAMRGDPRADLIRVQCALASPATPTSGERRAALVDRERELLRRHVVDAAGNALTGSASWVDGIQYPYGSAFWRGFIANDDDLHDHRAEITSIPEYLAAAEQTLRVVLFEDVKLDGPPGGQADATWASDEVWTQLVHHRILRRWRWLECSRPDLDLPRFRSLIESPHLCRLQKLSLSSSVGVDGLVLVAEAPNLASLQYLSWTETVPVDGDRAAIALARSTVLDLLSFWSNIRFGDAGLSALAGTPAVRNLETLGLSLSPDASGEVLGELLATIEGPLRYLSVEGLSSFDACAARLASTSALAGVEHLDLSQSSIGDAGLGQLLSCLGGELCDLAINVQRLSSAGFETLLTSTLPDEITLSLHGTPPDPALHDRLRARFSGFSDPDEDSPEHEAEDASERDLKLVEPAPILHAPAVEAWAVAVRSAVDALRVLDPKRQIYGASWHHYRFEAPLAADAIAALERQIGARLDPFYRGYMTLLGGSGAGPDNGICAASKVQRRGGRRCLLLSDTGCGGYRYLVVSGPNAHEVLTDGTGAGGDMGLEGVTFQVWFDAWLDAAIFEAALKTTSSTSLSSEERDALASVLSRLHQCVEVAPYWRGALASGSTRASLGLVHLALGDVARASQDLAAAIQGDDLTRILRDRLATRGA